MSLPDGVPTVTVTTGPRLSADGEAAYLAMTVAIDRTVIHAATGTVLGDELSSEITSTDGVVSVELVPVDAAEFVDENGAPITFWAYQLRLRVPGPVGDVWSRDFQPITANGPTVDLDLVPRGVPATDPVTGERVVVTSVAGLGGDVDAAELAGVLDEFLTGGGPGGVGDKGPTGDKGPVGDQGPVGDKGPTGDKGTTGDQGSAGDKGAVGDAGAKGLTGDKGPVGDKGATGDTGLKGATGDKGPTGDKGATGDAGSTALVRDEGTALPARGSINFVGAGVTATDDSTNGRTVVTVPGGISPTLVEAKGDLLIGSADDTLVRLPIGPDGYRLTARPGATPALAWEAVAAGGGILAVVTASLSADVTCPSNAATDVLSVPLSPGTWQVTTNIDLTAPAASVADVSHVVGTATATLAGAIVQPVRVGAAGIGYAAALTTNVVVTVGGTLIVRVTTSGQVHTAKYATNLSGQAPATSITALKTA